MVGGADGCAQPVHADPCQPATGEFYLPATDLVLPGRVTLAASRTYSSARATTAGVFGYGWSSVFDVHLTAPPVTGTATAPDPVEVQLPRGSVWLFDQFAGVGYYPARYGTHASLQRTQDGWAATQIADGTVYRFDADGDLTGIADRFGEMVSFTRTSGSITAATPDGRELVVALTSGRATTLTGPGDRVVSYGYDGSGNLTAITDPRGQGVPRTGTRPR